MATKRKATYHDDDDGGDGWLQSGSDDDEDEEVERARDIAEEKANSIIADLPSIPPSYWIARGYDDNYANAMVDFLNQFTELIYNIIVVGIVAPHATRREQVMELSSCQDVNHVSLTPDRMIRHDEALLPYWNMLAMVLCHFYPAYLKCRLWTEESPISICFGMRNVQLHKAVLDILAPSLKFNNVRDFELNNNDLDSNGISFAMDFMSKCQNIENGIYISNNPINCDLDTNLSARHYDSVICQIISKSPNIKYIALRGNNISTRGNTVLTDYLATNPNLEELYLRNNNFNDDDAIAFAEALRSNTHLKSLDLTLNNFTNTGYQIFLKAIFDPSSLNSVAGCNHTCQILLEEDDKGDFQMSTINEDNNPKVRKKLKIFSALAAPNKEYVNLSLLGNISSNKAIPSLLKFIQRYPKKYRWSNMIDPLLWQPSDREEVEIALQDYEDDSECESFSAVYASAREYYTTGKTSCKKEEKERQVKSLNVLFQVYRDWAVPTIICNH